MKTLTIDSKAHGVFVVLYDDCDEEIVKKYPTWGIKKNGGTFYVKTKIPAGNGKQKTLYMHRLLTNAPVGTCVDHINHCGWDNRQSNMRICSHTENHQNQLKTKRKTSSQYKGVSWFKRNAKWVVRIMVDSKALHIGYFTSEVDAAKAYDESALIHFGPYAQLNFPQPVVPTIINNTYNITINN